LRQFRDLYRSLTRASAAHERGHGDDKIRPQWPVPVWKHLSASRLPPHLNPACLDGVDVEFERDERQRVIGVERWPPSQSIACAMWKTVIRSS